ncbi:opsin-3-like [Watersipora subatra]|uniref:opsin-3-like n=1 Tax=Watersipora subatra TaxID=2589382 RepID=UPI00355C5DBA
MITSAAFYLAAWSPYAVICMLVSFGDAKLVPPILFTWLGFMAKLSFIFDPVIYIFTNNQYRKELSKLLFNRLSQKSKQQHLSNNNGEKEKFLASAGARGPDSSSGTTFQMSITSQSSMPNSPAAKANAGNISAWEVISEEQSSLVNSANKQRSFKTVEPSSPAHSV